MAVSPSYSTTPATGAVVVPDDQRTFLRNRVSWGAILAGVAAALVTQLLLNVLGIGIGLSALDVDQTADNPSAGGFSLTAGIWFVITGILASLLGGVVAGRLSGTSDDNTARWHGFVSWCVATLLLAYLLTTAVGGLVGGALREGHVVGADLAVGQLDLAGTVLQAAVPGGAGVACGHGISSGQGGAAEC